MDEQTGNESVLFERRGRVALITLHRPEAMNAVNADISAGLGRALATLQSDDDLWVGVLTGAGRAFCAGADLKALGAGQPINDPDHPEWGFGGIVQHFVDRPLIAAVNGFALGGGTELALACDLVVASESATFGLPEVTRGLVAAAGGLIRLGTQIPPKIALQMALTGESITADTAASWGLVNLVTAPGETVPAALELAETIADNAPLAVRASKRIMHRVAEFGSDWDEDVWTMSFEEAGSVSTSEDAIEGAVAFAEKRPPVWKGR